MNLRGIILTRETLLQQTEANEKNDFSIAKGETDVKTRIKTLIGKMFSITLLTIAVLLIGLAGFQTYESMTQGKELMTIFINAINTIIISLAIFELGIGVGKEYATDDEEQNTYIVIRRTIARFVGTVSIALVLESLIMIIKYSQLELAGNLYYPVGILTGASILLIGMGIFLHLTRRDCEETATLPLPSMQAPVVKGEKTVAAYLHSAGVRR
jgi:hypothetical protein